MEQGAARAASAARVDAAAKPAPLPHQMVKVIATADAVVFAFAAMGAFGPTGALRKLGAGLFAAAAAFVSAENIPKILARRAAAKAELTLAALPELSVKA